MIETTTRTLDKKGPNRVKPLAVPMMISNMAAGNVSIAFGLRGKSINVVTACATGTQSIGEAYRSIQVGEADVMVAGGTEAAVSEAAVSEAVESAVRSVQNTETFTARLWVSENAFTYSAVCSSESHSTFSCEFR